MTGAQWLDIAIVVVALIAAVSGIDDRDRAEVDETEDPPSWWGRYRLPAGAWRFVVVREGVVLGEGEVLVRIRAAGLCHSDLSVIDGNRPRPEGRGWPGA